MSANRSGGGALPGGFHAEVATACVGCRRAKRTASNPFSQRMTAVAVKTAKKTTALAPMLVQKTCRKPIDQEVAREPEQDQANPDDEGRNDEPDHGVLPWCLPSGSGDPDRHGLMIAEMRTLAA